MTCSPTSPGHDYGCWIDLVLEGGGVKGIALLGAIDHLAEQGFRFNRIAGSSVGALVGAFIATSPGDTIDRDRFRSLVFGPAGSNPDDHRAKTLPAVIVDHTIGSWFGWPGKAVVAVTRQGIYPGDALHHWVADNLPAPPKALDELVEPNPPPGLTARPRLKVTTTDLTAGTLVHLPDDDLAPWITSVPDAVRASTAIPFVFRPFAAGPAGGSRHAYVDGGTLSNFPIDVFDTDRATRPRFPTFGLRLNNAQDLDGQPHTNRTDGTYHEIRALLDTFTGFYDRAHAPVDDQPIMHIPTGDVSATDFGIDADGKRALFESGRNAATTFIETFDWKTHLADRGF